MEGCSHCVNLKPIWDNVVKQNKTGIEMKYIETGADGAKDLVDEDNKKIERFPTILLISGSKVIECNERTETGLLAFLKKHDK